MEEKSIEQMKREFKEFYYRRVKNNVASIEKNYNKAKLDSILVIGLLISISGLIFGGMIKSSKIFLVSFIVLAISLLAITLMNKDNKSNVIKVDASGEMYAKKALMEDFLKIFGDFTWNKGGTSARDNEYFRNVSTLNIMNRAIFCNIDDSISGVYNGMRFKILEVDSAVTLQNVLSFLVVAPLALILGCNCLVMAIVILCCICTAIFNVWGLLVLPISILAIIGYIIFYLTTYVPFRGVFVEFDMNKNFSGHTFLHENAPTSRGIVRSKVYTNEAQIMNFEEVKLEDIEFCKKYKIYSNDQVEARYVLTTAFIDRFKNMKTAFNANYIRAAFKDNKVTIAIDAGKDLFSMVGRNGKVNENTFIELFNEILSVLLLIDALKLDQKTGL